jgi:hypothetical protein
MREWKKSSYSNSFSNGVEVAWRRSSHSFSNGQRVEAASTGGTVLVRESKDPDGPVLTFRSPEWDAFIQGMEYAQFSQRSVLAGAA